MSEKLYGLYLGTCVDNADPQQRLRLRLQIPQLLGTAVTNWAEACVPVGGTDTPEAGATVWVMFMGGDPNYPVWIGVNV